MLLGIEHTVRQRIETEMGWISVVGRTYAVGPIQLGVTSPRHERLQRSELSIAIFVVG